MSAYEYVVRTKDLSKIYTLGGVEVRALDNVSLDIRLGEYLSIMGPSGSGKSTLFNMIGGLDKPTSGTVYIDEIDMATLNSAQMAWLRCHKIGFIFQTYNLMPNQTALENVTLPMVFAGMNKIDMRGKGMHLLHLVGLGDRADHKPNELSGGQQQRVAIARAFANDPVIILADEPTGNLDRALGREIIEILKKMNEKRKVTIITATHDDKMIDVSDRIAYVRDGKVERIVLRDEIELTLGTMEGE